MSTRIVVSTMAPVGVSVTDLRPGTFYRLCGDDGTTRVALAVSPVLTHDRGVYLRAVGTDGVCWFSNEVQRFVELDVVLNVKDAA